MEISQARPRPRPRSQSLVEELNSPGCAVPEHEPIGEECRPQGSRFSFNKLLEKFFPRVHVDRVQTHDSVTTLSIHIGTTQDTSQSEEVTHSWHSYEEGEGEEEGEEEEEEGEIPEHTHPTGSLTTPASDNVVQVIEPNSQRPLYKAKRKKGRRKFKNLLSKFFGSASAQEVATEVQLAPTTLTEAIPIDTTEDQDVEITTPTQTQEHTNTEFPGLTGVEESSPVENTNSSVENDQHTISIPIKSHLVHRTEDGIYVGLLHELPPPEVLEPEWRLLRAKLTVHLRQATRALPNSLKRQQKWFEPELCMSGEPLPEKQTVSLKPTIWISCGSPECQKIVQDAVNDLQYTRRFPVHVTQHAPQPASRQSNVSDSPHLQDESDEIQHYGMSGAIVEDDGYIRRSGDQIEIKVQFPLRNYNSACGLKVKIRVASGEEYVCRLGGLVRVNDTVLGLTTAHAIPNPSGNNNSEKAVSRNESLFIFDSGSEEISVSRDAPSDISLSTMAWLPAKLWLAGYGALPSSSGQRSTHSSHTSITLDEDMLCDFALLQIDFSSQLRPRNSYRNQAGVQNVEQHSDDLDKRAVDVVCSYEDVRSGWLLPGERIIASDTGCWKTRKIQLQEPLGRGFSGTWVVSDGKALGMIVAVYDTQPYAHMIPMASIFPSIRDTLRGRLEDPAVRILSTADNTALDLERSKAQPVLDPVVKKPNRNEPLQVPDDRLAAKSEKEKKDDAARPNSITGYLPRMEEPLVNIVCNLPTGLFVPMCLMVLAIGLDASAFPVIMPSITDTFDTTDSIGWFGSVYFLALGATFPLFHRLYPAMCRLSNKRGTVFTLLLVSALFEGGSLCCFFASNDTLMIVGRVLCGISAAGVMSGTAFTLKELSPQGPKSRMVRKGCWLTIYALSRFVGLLFGAALTDSVRTDRAWEYVFVINLAVMFLPILTLLACLTSYVRWNTAYHPVTAVEERTDLWLRFFRASFVLSSLLVVGSAILLEIAVYYRALSGWTDASRIGYAAGFAAGSLAILGVRRWWYWHYHESSDHVGRLFYRYWKKTIAMLLLSFSWGVSYHTVAYYLPFWLRAVRNYSVLGTGTRYLPTPTTYLFAIVVEVFWLSMYGRPIIFRILKRHVFLLSSLAYMALSSGLMTRFDDGTPTATVVGLQVLFGAAAGVGALQAREMDPLATQHGFDDSPLPYEERMTWQSLAVFAEMLGGSVGISAAQTVFMTLLSRGVDNNSGLDLDDILHAGITNFREGLSGERLDVAVGIFNHALTRSFYVSTAAAALMIGLCVLLAPYWLWRREGIDTFYAARAIMRQMRPAWS